MAIDYARFDRGWALLNTDTTVEKSKGFVNVELFNGLGEFSCGVRGPVEVRIVKRRFTESATILITVPTDEESGGVTVHPSVS